MQDGKIARAQRRFLDWKAPLFVLREPVRLRHDPTLAGTRMRSIALAGKLTPESVRLSRFCDR